MASLKEKYIASMVLSGVGDAMGFKQGDWEFCHSGITIHEEAEKLGGIEKLKIKLPDWPVSDDTVLHLATAESYMEQKDVKDKETLYRTLAQKYKDGMHDMSGRSPGPTTMNACHNLKPLREKGYQIPFNERGGGCGAAMRSMCIGLRYPKPEHLEDLIADSVESGRMTHHHPTGYLGSLAGALFTSYALQEKPVISWGAGLMETLEKAKTYIRGSHHAVEPNLNNWDYFQNEWEKYLKERNLTSGEGPVKFPSDYGIEARDQFYKSVSFSGWGGASGHDAPMIAYDALLGSGDSWMEVCKRGILHSGDNDSTGVMIGAWFGALYGYLGVPDCHYKELEYRGRLEKAGATLFELSQGKSTKEEKCTSKEKEEVKDSKDSDTKPEGTQNKSEDSLQKDSMKPTQTHEGEPQEEVTKPTQTHEGEPQEEVTKPPQTNEGERQEVKKSKTETQI